ncbi:DUF2637 domain-containing protein [Arthrobacter sp. MYb211]|uniref:DUF2637 domain-containing protein n=1 Tax=Micrococcaceae TaxID=1268 RepID=UPI000BB8CC31|nr:MULTISPECIES: DUF2637 domain-containing protein [Micrococcaceae]PCC27346.1 excisionase [Glutamicibacter sp. BW80]PRA01020.1 DUF2637 domain-containing protein [Arthrobacter sp. MYb224]PRA06818.1 DUF2637 domain-containing protein [Arthrobacter sp. MYb229]PRA13963.1 DUF2637 domain-containing protein [Arthrobacter sp. MYb221]PRB53720.1 DUF2637 domain-containing protein [Arthrobacter sp. MYb216]
MDNKPEIPREPHRAVLGTAVGATVLIAIGAFVLSFAALTDLAERSGIDSSLAWIWPIIIDGMIVAATVAIVALNGFNRKAMIYPWSLLFFGAIVSTAANSTHAILTVDSIVNGVPPLVSALVAAMPPIVLLAITHLTVHMYQKKSEASKLRAEYEYDEDAANAEKYGVAYDDGYNAALTDSQQAEAERVAQLEQDHQDAIARARAEAIAQSRAEKVTPLKQAPAASAPATAAKPKNDDKAPLYEDMAKRLSRPQA